MKLYARSTSVSKPYRHDVRTVALSLAILLIVLVVAQLFSFEKFIPLLESYQLPGGVIVATFLAALIVTLEVFALPFLIMMKVSSLMRIVSMISGWLAFVILLLLQIWQNTQLDSFGSNNGLLGAPIALPVGWWSVFFVAALGVLHAWASWGIWPIHRNNLVARVAAEKGVEK